MLFIVQLILKACQTYGIIHTDVGFVDFGIEAAYDPRCDDVLPGTEGTPYGKYNPARAGPSETTLGIGHGLQVDLRYGPSGYDPGNKFIIRNSDWELIQFGYKV